MEGLVELLLGVAYTLAAVPVVTNIVTLRSWRSARPALSGVGAAAADPVCLPEGGAEPDDVGGDAGPGRRVAYMATAMLAMLLAA